MIREATQDDIEILLILGKKFFDATEYSRFTSYSVEATKATVKHLIGDDNGILLVLDDDGVKGMIGALIYPFYMSGDLTGQELFWWCEEKGKGLDLLWALEDKAKDIGVKTFTMLSLDQLTPERLDKIYTSRGYVRSEHTYLREL